MQHLGGLLDTSVMTVSGKTLAENLAGYVYEYPEDPTIIKTVEDPFSKTGGVAVLHGNLCPRHRRVQARRHRSLHASLCG